MQADNTLPFLGNGEAMSKMPPVNSSFDHEQGSSLLDAMANESRLCILDILTRGEMSVGRLSQAVGLSQSALSQHLAKLRIADLVSTRREAQTIYYSCQSEPVMRVLKLLTEFFEDGPAHGRLSA